MKKAVCSPVSLFPDLGGWNNWGIGEAVSTMQMKRTPVECQSNKTEGTQVPSPQTESWKKTTYLAWTPDYPWTDLRYVAKKIPFCFSLYFLGLCYSTLAFTQTNIYHVSMCPCSTTPCHASSWSHEASAPECRGKQTPFFHPRALTLCLMLRGLQD